MYYKFNVSRDIQNVQSLPFTLQQLLFVRAAAKYKIPFEHTYFFICMHI